MEEEMKNANTTPGSSPGDERRQLGYCQRCGALRVVPLGNTRPFCPACARVMRWLLEEAPDASAHR
jgi:hypothetical protein